MKANMNRVLKIEHRGSTPAWSPRDPLSSIPAFRSSTLDFRSFPPRRGFSFAEVMFAVVILGIGFILVAAIFPVAIQQTQSTGEESTAAAAAREAANTIGSIPTSTVNPLYLYQTPVPTPKPQPNLLSFVPTVKNYTLGTAPDAVAPPAIVAPFVGSRWDAIKGNIIVPSDPRYAYVPFYRRENNSSSIQLIVVAVAVRNKPVYASQDTSPASITPTAVTTTYGVSYSSNPQTIITPDTVSVNSGTPTEGSYVAVQAASELVAAQAGNPAGRTYLFGRFITGSQFEISPGDGLSLAPGPNGLWGTSASPTPTQPHDVVLAADMNWNLITPGPLQPIAAYAMIQTSPAHPFGRITLSKGITYATGASASNVSPPSAVPGAFVVVADDYAYDPANPSNVNYPLQPNTATAIVGSVNGRIFRLGQPVPSDSTATPPIPPGTFELDPAYGVRQTGAVSPDTIPLPFAAPPADPFTGGPHARVYLVGGAGIDPASGSYAGASQAVGAFTTFIQVQ